MSHRNSVLAVLAGLVAIMLNAAALAADATPATSKPAQASVKTGKERLGDKASDEQRVDDCKVPPERRGRRIRPDSCQSNN